MTFVVSLQCESCRYFVDDLGNWHCKAFPDGIPDAIIQGIDHKKPYPGDHGIQFVKKKVIKPASKKEKPVTPKGAEAPINKSLTKKAKK